MSRVIIDTGPIVALFDRRDTHHQWANGLCGQFPAPLFTCESVIAEAVFIMRRSGLDPRWLMETLDRGVFQCDFDFAAEFQAIRALFRRYEDRAISIADAALVRMSELTKDSVIFTLDRDFLIYRRNGRQKIPLLAPFSSE